MFEGAIRLMEKRDLQLRRYLLGGLEGETMVELDLKLLTDEEFGVDLELAEEELIEDYLDQSLTEDERTRFESIFLVPIERREQLGLSRQLRRYSKEVLENLVSKQKSFLDTLIALFSNARVTAYAAGAMIFLGAVSASVYFLAGRGGQVQKLQSEYAAINQGDLGDLEKYRGLQTIELLPGSTRGSGQQLKTPGGSETSIFVRLAMPIEFRDRTDIDLRLIRETTELMSFESVRAYGDSSGKEIRFLLPSKILEKGAYRIDVMPTGQRESFVSYFFTVE